jgi:hypothetical protein
VLAAPRILEDYVDAIRILREKKFTFREIAEWLKEHFDIPADHNSVWRAYTKHMSFSDAHWEAEVDDLCEKEEALAEADANGSRIPIAPTAVESAATNAEKETLTSAPAKPKRARKK